MDHCTLVFNEDLNGVTTITDSIRWCPQHGGVDDIREASTTILTHWQIPDRLIRKWDKDKETGTEGH